MRLPAVVDRLLHREPKPLTDAELEHDPGVTVPHGLPASSYLADEDDHDGGNDLPGGH
jgi:hypothetical protein